MILSGFTGLTLWVLKNENFQRLKTIKKAQTSAQNVVSQEIHLKKSGDGTVLYELMHQQALFDSLFTLPRYNFWSFPSFDFCIWCQTVHGQSY